MERAIHAELVKQINVKLHAANANLGNALVIGHGQSANAMLVLALTQLVDAEAMLRHEIERLDVEWSMTASQLEELKRERKNLRNGAT